MKGGGFPPSPDRSGRRDGEGITSGPAPAPPLPRRLLCSPFSRPHPRRALLSAGSCACKCGEGRGRAALLWGGGTRGCERPEPAWAGGKRGRAPRGTAGARGWGVHECRLGFYGRAAGVVPGPQLGRGLRLGMAAPSAPRCRMAELGPGALSKRCIQALGTWGQRVERCSRVQHPC